jgi:hypothetical protein
VSTTVWMSELVACGGCGGFANATAATCPHCGARTPRGRRRRVGILLGLAGSASLGLTMMACYGAPPCEPGTSGCKSAPDATSGTKADAGATD